MARATVFALFCLFGLYCNQAFLKRGKEMRWVKLNEGYITRQIKAEPKTACVPGL